MVPCGHRFCTEARDGEYLYIYILVCAPGARRGPDPWFPAATASVVRHVRFIYLLCMFVFVFVFVFLLVWLGVCIYMCFKICMYVCASQNPCPDPLSIHHTTTPPTTTVLPQPGVLPGVPPAHHAEDPPLLTASTNSNTLHMICMLCVLGYWGCGWSSSCKAERGDDRPFCFVCVR
jgi:hypothetical protein